MITSGVFFFFNGLVKSDFQQLHIETSGLNTPSHIVDHMGKKMQTCTNTFPASRWVRLRLKESIFLFQWEMMQGSSGFTSASAATIVWKENTSLMDRWGGFEKIGPECHPPSPLQTKTLPEKPPLMKWTGQRNKAWAKHLLADHYYLVNKARKRMRMHITCRITFYIISDIQWSRNLFHLWSRATWIKTH